MLVALWEVLKESGVAPYSAFSHHYTQGIQGLRESNSE